MTPNGRAQYQSLYQSSLLEMHPSSDRPSVWFILSVFTGLPILLWAYKSTIVYAFQRKIIYMGYAPPGARQEELSRDVSPRLLKDISCEEISVTSTSKVKLSGILVRSSMAEGLECSSPDTVIVYLQGNAGNPLHRLPVFQTLLRPNTFRHSSTELPTSKLAILAVAPRSYWKSSPRSPTEKGLTTDYLHVLKYAVSRFPEAKIVVYGHSLGGAIAVCLLSRLFDDEGLAMNSKMEETVDHRFSNIRGLILENPLASIPEMTKALYPDKWTPYHYMGPLTWDKWDAAAAMRSARSKGTVLGRVKKDMLVMVSGNDEVVPKEMGGELWVAGRDAGDTKEGPGSLGRHVVIRDALHENAWEHQQWLKEMTCYISDVRRR